MKFKVTITQNLKYHDTITGMFTSLVLVQQFIETVLNHFEAVSVSIDVITEEEDDEKDKEAVSL